MTRFYQGRYFLPPALLMLWAFAVASASAFAVMRYTGSFQVGLTVFVFLGASTACVALASELIRHPGFRVEGAICCGVLGLVALLFWYEGLEAKLGDEWYYTALIPVFTGPIPALMVHLARLQRVASIRSFANAAPE